MDRAGDHRIRCAACTSPRFHFPLCLGAVRPADPSGEIGMRRIPGNRIARVSPHLRISAKVITHCGPR